MEFVTVLEKDYIPSYTSVLPPWLSRHDLYFDSKEDSSKFHKFNNLVLFNIDGEKSISQLACLSGLAFTEVYDYLEKFVTKGFIAKKV
jgi:aminopeptidase-like protein